MTRVTHQILSLLFCFGITFDCLAADPVTELESFSKFANVELSKLATGEILGQRGPLMDFPRGISVQTCYITPASTDRLLKGFMEWDPSRHEALGVHLHQIIQIPATENDFKKLDLISKKASVQWLVDKTLATTTEKSDLQISRAEAALIANSVKNRDGFIKGNMGTSPADLASSCWRDILKGRLTKFLREGLLRVPSYEMGYQSVIPGPEFQSLLKDQPKIVAYFAPLLRTTLIDKKSEPSRPSPQCYWDLLEVNGHGVLVLGAQYYEHENSKYQMVDYQYYASGAYYASMTLRQLWPITIEGKPATLVWQGDLLSAPSLAFTRGVDRIAYGGIMLQETKKAIRYFREDLAKMLQLP